MQLQNLESSLSKLASIAGASAVAPNRSTASEVRAPPDGLVLSVNEAGPATDKARVAANETSAKEVTQAVDQANRALQALSASVTFYLDRDSDRMVVRIVDTESNKVLRQIPSQEMLDIAKALDRVQGLLFNTSA